MITKKSKKMTAKLTIKQKRHLHTLAYNEQFNELFKLHKFLVECTLTEHSVGHGNPVDDAIKLMEALVYGKENHFGSMIDKLNNKIDDLTFKDGWEPIDSAPLDGTKVLLKAYARNFQGWVPIVGLYNSFTHIGSLGWCYFHHDIYADRERIDRLDAEPLGWMRLPK